VLFRSAVEALSDVEYIEASVLGQLLKDMHPEAAASIKGRRGWLGKALHGDSRMMACMPPGAKQQCWRLSAFGPIAGDQLVEAPSAVASIAAAAFRGQSAPVPAVAGLVPHLVPAIAKRQMQNLRQLQQQRLVQQQQPQAQQLQSPAIPGPRPPSVRPPPALLKGRTMPLRAGLPKASPHLRPPAAFTRGGVMPVRAFASAASIQGTIMPMRADPQASAAWNAGWLRGRIMPVKAKITPPAFALRSKVKGAGKGERAGLVGLKPALAMQKGGQKGGQKGAFGIADLSEQYVKKNKRGGKALNIGTEELQQRLGEEDFTSLRDTLVDILYSETPSAPESQVESIKLVPMLAERDPELAKRTKEKMGKNRGWLKSVLAGDERVRQVEVDGREPNWAIAD